MKNLNTLKAISATALLMLAEGVLADPGDPIPVSEPSSFILLALGLATVFLSRRAK